jgi:hypothetical protein
MRGGLATRNMTSLLTPVQLMQDGTDVSSAANSAVLDRSTYGRQEMANNVLFILLLRFTTASGATNDEVDLTININEGDDSAGDDAVFATLTDSLVVDDDDEEKVAMYVFDADFVPSERYIMVDVALEAGTGTPTVSAAVASLVAIVIPTGEQPDVANYTKGALRQIEYAAA